MIERNDRATIVGLALFRIFIGGLVIVTPWVFGVGLDPYGATVLAAGVAIVAGAPFMHRAPGLRWVQAALAMELFFSPFAFPSDDVNAWQVYAATMLGFMTLMSSMVSPALFRQDEEVSASTIESELLRSSASNTSSVSTPPN